MDEKKAALIAVDDREKLHLFAEIVPDAIQCMLDWATGINSAARQGGESGPVARPDCGGVAFESVVRSAQRVVRDNVPAPAGCRGAGKARDVLVSTACRHPIGRSGPPEPGNAREMG